MKGLLALYQMTAREFFRDRMSVFITLLLPLLLAVFFGLIFSDAPAYSLSLGVMIEDEGPAGEMFARVLEALGLKDAVHLKTGERDELKEAVEEGRLAAALIIPRGLSEEIAGGQTAAVEVYYDPQRDVSRPALVTLRKLVQEANQALTGAPILLMTEELSVTGVGVPTAHSYIPGTMCLAVLWLGIFGTAPPLVDMRERRILRRFGVTPLRRPTLLSAQIGWRLTTAVIQGLLLTLLGLIYYRITLGGSLVLFAAAFLLGALVFIMMGFFLSGLARSVDGVIALGQVVMFPMMFLSGIMFPFEMLPGFLQSIARLIPLTYLGDALGQTLLGAPGINPLGLNFIVLGGWLVGLTALSLRFFRWE